MKADGIRVLHIQKVAGIAGSENHLLTLLPELPNYGYEPTMLVLAGRRDRPGPFVERIRAVGVAAEIVPVWGDLDPFLITRLARFIRRGRFAIVHTHLLHADLYGTLAARVSGVPIVVATRHNDDVFRRFYPVRRLVSWSSRRADRVLCICRNLKEFCAQVEGIPEEKLTVVHYGRRADVVTSNSTLRSGFGWNKEVPVLGIVARLTRQKGHSALLKAMPHVVRRFLGVQLAVVGDGELRHELERTAVRLGVAEHIHFLGYREDAAVLMPEFDVFVHPSRWEGFGMVFLEAMAAGIPVVATRIGSIPEIIEHGKTGLLVPVDDVQALAEAICILLADGDQRARMGLAGRRRLEEVFTVERMVAKTCALYKELLAQASPET